MSMYKKSQPRHSNKNAPVNAPVCLQAKHRRYAAMIRSPFPDKFPGLSVPWGENLDNDRSTAHCDRSLLGCEERSDGGLAGRNNC